MKIQNFTNIVQNYKFLFFDIWGVVHDGIESYNNTVDLIHKLDKTHKVYFLSNAPRTNEIIAHYLKTKFGVQIPSSNFMTSGEQTGIYFARNHGAKIYVIGEKYLDGLKLPPVNYTGNINDATHLLFLDFLDNDIQINMYDDLFQKAIKNNVTFVCANPDKAVIHGSATKYCAGFFAERYEELGGKVDLQGKPDILIYQSLANKIADFKKSETLMIGDTFHTDIEGAKNFGIDSALVLTGNSGREIHKIMQDNSIDYEEAYEIFMKKQKNQPTHIVHGVF